MKKNYELIISILLFTVILLSHYPFYKAIILMLEFIVIIEVVKMIGEFIDKKRLRLRYVLDVFIIFLTREVLILTSLPQKPYEDILFLLFVIMVFFVFRILALIYSPLKYKKSKDAD